MKQRKTGVCIEFPPDSSPDVTHKPKIPLETIVLGRPCNYTLSHEQTYNM